MEVIEPMILQGHVLNKLRELPDESVHCCITSPPYMGLRSYQTVPQVWGGDPDCQHDWVAYIRKGQSGGTNSEKVQVKGRDNLEIVPASEQATCSKCGAWKGELGSEATPDCGCSWVNSEEMELRSDLSQDERGHVIAELMRLGVLR